MPQVGFEPMIPVFERAKTVNALDRAAAVIGFRLCIPKQIHLKIHAIKPEEDVHRLL
jgi:hypothetical protein